MKKAEIDINNLPDINKRLYEFAIKSAGSIYAFSKSIKQSQPRINSLFHVSASTGKYPVIQSDILEAILIKYDLNTDWLFTGSGSMLKNISETSKEISIEMPSVPALDVKEEGGAVIPSLLSIIKDQGEALKDIALNNDKQRLEEQVHLLNEIQGLKEALESQQKEFKIFCQKLDALISQSNLPKQKKVS